MEQGLGNLHSPHQVSLPLASFRLPIMLTNMAHQNSCQQAMCTGPPVQMRRISWRSITCKLTSFDPFDQKTVHVQWTSIRDVIVAHVISISSVYWLLEHSSTLHSYYRPPSQLCISLCPPPIMCASIRLSVHPPIILNHGQRYIPKPHFTCQIIDTEVLV